MTEHEPQPNEHEEGTPAPRRRWLLPLVIVLLLLVLGAGGGVGFAYWALYRPVALAKPMLVRVPLRTSFADLAARLQGDGIIPNALAFRVYGRITGKTAKLKAGEYALKPGLRPIDILDVLISGRTTAYWVTIPEGKWVRETAPFLTEHWPEAARDFSALARDLPRWKRRFAFIDGQSLEGYLFPSTYLISKEATGTQIITQMLTTFKTACWERYQAEPPADGRSFYDVLVLASLVEAEAKVAGERARIAGVYLNRLHKGMKLECDATVLYAKGARLKRVLYRDLEVDSPYNTYRNMGLPPGPICNPGQASFTAALHPESHGYFYYVARGDGSHQFSTTFSEHQAAIRRIRGE